MLNAYPDWIGIIIAAVINMAIGAIWYSSLLFGPTWQKISGNKEESWGIGKLVTQLVLSLVTAFFIDFFQRHLAVTTVTDGMFVAFCFWLGFVAPTQFSSLLWGKGKFKLFAINGGYRLLAYLAMGGLIAS